MALPKDKEPDVPESPAGQEPAGRVEFDSRGNSVWRWARDVLDSTSILLKRLENKDLAIEPTQKVPVMRGGKADQADKAGKAGRPGKPEKKSSLASAADLGVSADAGGRDNGGGFDPYNSRR
jgi:hypothetical protein